MKKMHDNNNLFFHIEEGFGPLIASSIHSGHAVRNEISDLLALDESARLREEDPFTDSWTVMGNTRIIGYQSRFEFDLNRPRDKAIYISPEDAWGLHVWKTPPDMEIINRSISNYDFFYTTVNELLTRLIKKHDKLVVFDLHSYNHKRDGANAPPADPKGNPEVNVGTKSMDRNRWAPIVDRFIKDLSDFDFNGRQLDVRENVKFGGGNFSKWIHTTFPESVSVLAIEVKKFFMDEWTGIPNKELLELVRSALQSTTRGILEELQKE